MIKKILPKRPVKTTAELDNFRSVKSIEVPFFVKSAIRILFLFLLILILILSLTPWRQTAKGFGYIIANDPNDRVQAISATVSGRISKWYVRDGNMVKEGDKLAEIIDNDPQIIERLEAERDAKKRKYEFSTIAAQTAKIDYERQEEMFKMGLSSRKSFELAKIEYKKLLALAETAASELAESETKLSRQQMQIITAPKDGIILQLLAGNNSTLVKAGDKIATFAPHLKEPAIELYVNGNDIALIYQNRKVRLQFEGWPAIQFSGFPSFGIGTFGGIVSAVDSSISENGKFRIIVNKDPNEEWPDSRMLRHGAKVYGWVLLNNVKLGYELWRQINGFPAEFDKNHPHHPYSNNQHHEKK